MQFTEAVTAHPEAIVEQNQANTVQSITFGQCNLTTRELYVSYLGSSEFTWTYGGTRPSRLLLQQLKTKAKITCSLKERIGAMVATW